MTSVTSSNVCTDNCIIQHHHRHITLKVPGVVVCPLLLYCEMLGDVSSYKATLQSEGK